MLCVMRDFDHTVGRFTGLEWLYPVRLIHGLQFTHTFYYLEKSIYVQRGNAITHLTYSAGFFTAVFPADADK